MVNERKFPVQPAKTIRPRANAAAVRYWIHVFERPDGTEFYTIRRTHPKSAIHECWAGRERGWVPVTADEIGKRYARYGAAHKTLRAQQERDRASFTAAGKRRHLERLAPRMLQLLESIVQGFDEGSSSVLDDLERARATIAVAKRGY